MTLSVIVVQVGLMEHLGIHVTHQHVVHETGADEVQNLSRDVGVKRRLNRIVVDAGELRLVIRPACHVVEDVVGMPRHLVQLRRIAVHDAHIR